MAGWWNKSQPEVVYGIYKHCLEIPKNYMRVRGQPDRDPDFPQLSRIGLRLKYLLPHFTLKAGDTEGTYIRVWTTVLLFLYYYYEILKYETMRITVTFAKIDTECTFFLLFTTLSTRSATDSPTDQDLWPFTRNSSMALSYKKQTNKQKKNLRKCTKYAPFSFYAQKQELYSNGFRKAFLKMSDT